jgi:hypothetical protein
MLSLVIGVKYPDWSSEKVSKLALLADPPQKMHLLS